MLDGDEILLAVNAGSSSLKFAAYTSNGGDPASLLKGAVEDSGKRPKLVVASAGGDTLIERSWGEPPGHEALIGRVLDLLDARLGPGRLAIAGHRIVHGGSRFVAPVRLTADSIAAIETLTALAPLHQPLGLAPVHALRHLRPELAQIACFDTAFHHELASPASRYGVPREYEARGVRRYGFHGLSYEYIARRLSEIDPHVVGKRVVVAHLGSGASLCAMRDGRSIDTTMGFSTLDGLIMGTRSGSIDPGILLYLLREEGLTPAALEDLLYRKSGLLGVSDVSSDIRDLLASPDPRAADALDLFAFRVARETAAMASSLGGLDAFIFTGGVGEHIAPIRRAIVARLGWLGAKLDEKANAAAGDRIDSSKSAVELRIIPTDEELTIARQVCASALDVAPSGNTYP